MSNTVYPTPPMQQPQQQPAAAPMGMAGGMDPKILTAMLSDPRTPPGQRAAAMAALNMGKAPPASPPPQGAPAAAPAPTVDVGAALRQGVAMADGAPSGPPPGMIPQRVPQQMGMARGGPVRRYAPGGPVLPDDPDADATPPDGGLSAMDPRMIAMIKQAMQSDDAPTSHDKGLALAQAGFGIAASPSPHFGQALGEGALYGVNALQQLRKQRAEQSMRAAALAGSLTQGQDRLAIQKGNLARQKDADAQRVIDKAADRDLRLDIAKGQRDNQEAVQAGLAEQRYSQNDLRRRQQYQQTGQWAALPGDDTHGVGGPPDLSPFEGPLIENPNVGAKEKQKLIVSKPTTTQAVTMSINQLGDMATKADELLQHPGLSKATGFGGETLSKISGTDAANFAAKMHSLQADTFVNNLAAMRASSKTGGAVGQVSDREGDRMASLQASLAQAQTKEQIESALSRIADYAKRTGGTMRDAYVQTYGEKGAPKLPWEKDEVPPAPDATTPGADDGIQALIAKHRTKVSAP